MKELTRYKRQQWEGAATFSETPGLAPASDCDRLEPGDPCSAGEALAKGCRDQTQLVSGTFSDTKLTVKSYLAQWLSHKEGSVKPRTVEIYRHLSTYHIAPKIGHKRIDKLTPLDVHGLVTEVASCGGARTANQCLTVLFSTFKKAVRWQLVPRNVVEATDPLRKPHAR